MTWKVYIIQTDSGKLYTGITTDMERRFDEHLSGKNGARFFNFSNPKTILFQESVDHSLKVKESHLKKA